MKQCITSWTYVIIVERYFRKGSILSHLTGHQSAPSYALDVLLSSYGNRLDPLYNYPSSSPSPRPTLSLPRPPVDTIAFLMVFVQLIHTHTTIDVRVRWCIYNWNYYTNKSARNRLDDWRLEIVIFHRMKIQLVVDIVLDPLLHTDDPPRSGIKINDDAVLMTIRRRQ